MALEAAVMVETEVPAEEMPVMADKNMEAERQVKDMMVDIRPTVLGVVVAEVEALEALAIREMEMELKEVNKAEMEELVRVTRFQAPQFVMPEEAVVALKVLEDLEELLAEEVVDIIRPEVLAAEMAVRWKVRMVLVEGVEALMELWTSLATVGTE